MKNLQSVLIFFVPYVFCNFEVDEAIDSSRQGREIEIKTFAAKKSKIFL